MAHDERQIIDDILNGKSERFALLMERHADKVYSLVAGVVSNREDAEELTQDVFLKAFQKLRTFKAGSQFSTWLYRIAYNTAISHTRRAHNEKTIMDDTMLSNIREEEIDDIFDSDTDETIEKLHRALEKLPHEERALVTLFYMNEQPIAEIARVLDISESNAKVKLHRTRKKLYLLIQKDDE